MATLNEQREAARARMIADCDQLREALESIIAGDDPKKAKRARRSLLKIEHFRARISGDYSRLKAVREQMQHKG